jgi:acyl-CoA synthetase (NDP forming)
VEHVPEPRVKHWLRAFGIEVPNGCALDLQAVAGDALPGVRSETLRELGDLRPPLALKAFGPGVVHKTELGAVRLGLSGVSQVTAAAREMRARLAARGITPAGFYVEEQVRAGAEVIVGAVADPVFGAVLLAGLGGVWTEALGDTVLRICPVTEADARSMLSALRGGAVLTGLRGAPAVDLDALVRVLLAVGGRGGVAEALGGALAEFELNPVVCTSSRAVAVDARLVLAPGAWAGGGPTAARASSAQGSPPGSRGPDAGSRGAVTDFARLFAPRGIAVAGASTKKPGFGNMFLRFYRRAGYAGKLVAVHPTASEIDGIPAVASFAEAGGGIDYALIAVPAARCADAVRSARGIPFVQVMSGGFRETGAEGAALESGLAAAARAAGARLLGPNCMGVYSPAGGQTFIGGEPGQPGRIAVVSQSGGMAGEIIRAGEHRGLRFAAVATVGNSADVTPAELLGWFGAQDVSVAGLYLEDPRDGRELFAILRDLRGRLPAVALVGGRSRQGRRAAASHTGGMVNDGRVWAALAAQTGIALVRSQDELIGVLDFFDQHAGRMRGGAAQAADGMAPAHDAASGAAAAAPEGVLVVGPSGGASVLAADVFDDAGVAMPPLSSAARGKLASLGLGAGSSLANPLEVPAGPGGRVELIRDAVRAICSHHAYADLVVHLNVLSFFTFGNSVESLLAYVGCAAELQGFLEGTRVTLVLRNVDCAPPGAEDEARARARAGGVPVYRGMEAAAAAIAAGQSYVCASPADV